MKPLFSLDVLLVEDDPRFRHGLHTFLTFYRTSDGQRPTVVGEADSAQQAIQRIQQQRPWLVLLDLELVDSDGMTVLLELRKLALPSKVIVLSAHQEDERIFQAMQAGAAGYVLKPYLITQLPEALKAMLKSEIYLPAAVASGFFRRFQTQEQSRWRLQQQLRLTEREQEVLTWLAQGASNDEIAKQLYVTVATVKAHLTSIFEKLQVTNRTQAIVTALKLGIVQTWEQSWEHS